MSDDFKYPNYYDIGWEKWIDAYDQEIENQDLDDFDDDLDDDSELNNSSVEELNKIFGEITEYTPMIKSIMTPYGILPLTEHSLASRHFKFWVGHCNFVLGDGKITSLKDFEKLIGGVVGVEAVDVLTPLRFRIAIGKMFKDRDVMDKIKNILVAYAEKVYGKKTI